MVSEFAYTSGRLAEIMRAARAVRRRRRRVRLAADYVLGANISGFVRVADAMLAQKVI